MTQNTANSKSSISSEKPPSSDCKLSKLLQPLKITNVVSPPAFVEGVPGEMIQHSARMT